MVISERLASHKLDYALWGLGVLLVLSLAGFAGYYYLDRYVHPDQKVAEHKEKQFAAMIEKDPQNGNLRVALASLYLEEGLLEDAIQQSGEALKIDAQNQEALILLGRTYDRAGEKGSAISYFEQVIDLNRDNPMARIDKRLQAVYYEVGTLYSQQGKYPEAVSALKNALAIDRTDADARYALGAVYQRQGDHEAAVGELREGLRFDPFFLEAYQALAVSYGALGRATDAAYAQGMVLLTQGNYGNAAAQLEGVIKQEPQFTQAYFGLGLAYEKLGKRAQAVTALHEYLKVNPNDIAAQQALGRLTKEVKP